MQEITLMTNPLLTIAIPTYNRASLLNACLSALAKEFGGNPDIEVLVSDNASTDDTEKIVQSHKEVSFPGLLYVKNNANLGADYNIRQAFEKATGKFVWIFSDDDIFLGSYGRPIIDLLTNND